MRTRTPTSVSVFRASRAATAVCSLSLLLSVLCAGTASAQQALSDKAGCTVCHAAQKKTIGPSYRDIAVKYKGRPDAMALLTERVRNGSKGVWGTLPMPPTPRERISDAELKALLGWVLVQ